MISSWICEWRNVPITLSIMKWTQMQLTYLHLSSVYFRTRLEVAEQVGLFQNSFSIWLPIGFRALGARSSSWIGVRGKYILSIFTERCCGMDGGDHMSSVKMRSNGQGCSIQEMDDPGCATSTGWTARIQVAWIEPLRACTMVMTQLFIRDSYV
jgi:hypothetical protein